MHHALASRRVSHEDDFAVIVSEFVDFVFIDILDTLSNLIGISIEMPQTPRLVGRCEVQCK